MALIIPAGSINDLEKYKISIIHLIENEIDRRCKIVNNYLSTKVSKFLSREIKNCDSITNSKNSLEYTEIDNVIEFTWRIDNSKLIVEYFFAVPEIYARLETFDNMTSFKWQDKWRKWGIQGLYPPSFDMNLLNIATGFLDQLTSSYSVINKLLNLCRSTTENCKLFPIAETEEAIICMLNIRWFRESILSELPKDIVRLIGKILWKDRNNFFC